VRSAPLPVNARIVPVRHRLRKDLPASSFLPFVVELFAAGCFARSPSLVMGPVPLVAQQGAPYAGRG
jgi:hypothetical protein